MRNAEKSPLHGKLFSPAWRSSLRDMLPAILVAVIAIALSLLRWTQPTPADAGGNVGQHPVTAPAPELGPSPDAR